MEAAKLAVRVSFGIGHRRMYFIQYEVRPHSDSEHFATVGGAIVNCFIDA